MDRFIIFRLDAMFLKAFMNEVVQPTWIVVPGDVRAAVSLAARRLLVLARAEEGLQLGVGEVQQARERAAADLD